MNTDIPISLDVGNLPISTDLSVLKSGGSRSRKRSNSQSQVISIPKVNINIANKKRIQVQYYVTLLPLNDTFTKKHLPIAIFPETTKLGRPTGTRHKPDVNNGYFDSRVLSRNHAQMYIDSLTGKLMLQDLGSSNGTYLNDQRLGNDAVEIKIGDTVCLGFNVQTESTHKQISLKIENINIIKNSELDIDVPQFKHLSFIEDIYKQVALKKPVEEVSSDVNDMNDITYDNALFGDINNNIEDDLLGLYSQTNAGIYNNSQITNTSTFESIIHILLTNLAKIKQQNNNLQSLQFFLVNYQNSLNDLNTKYLEQELSKHLVTIQTDLAKERDLNQKFTEQFKMIEQEQNDKIYKMNIKHDELNQENQQLKSEITRLQSEANTKKVPGFRNNAIIVENLLDSPQSDEFDDDNEAETNRSLVNGHNDRNGTGNSNGKLNNRNDNDNDNNNETSQENGNENRDNDLISGKQVTDIDINELFHGLSTNDDIKKREHGHMNSSKSSISELEVSDTEDTQDENSINPIIQPFSPTLSTPDDTQEENNLLNGSSNHEIRRELNDRFQDNLHQQLLSQQKIQQERERNQQIFPTKSDDRFNSNEEMMQRVIIAVGAMLFGYVFKKISG